MCLFCKLQDFFIRHSLVIFQPRSVLDDVPDFLNMPVEESGNDDTTEVPIFANNAANEAAEKETETSEEEEAEGYDVC